MTNKTENYEVTAPPLNQDFVKHVYILFPLHSKFSCILDFIRLPIEFYDTTTVHEEFWEKK